LGYGPCENSLEAFLGSIGSLNSPHSATHHVSDYVSGGFAYHSPYTLTPVLPLTGPATFLRHPIAWLLPAQIPCIHTHIPRREHKRFRTVSITDSPLTRSHGYGNINPLSIGYACRPRLRSRLTLGGLTWPRNPWSFGGQVSHLSFATHACILTRAPSTTRSPRCFHGYTTLPYPPTHLAPIP
jgi:hypothetical protein